MDARVVELNALADPVGTAAEHHDLAVGGNGHLVLRIERIGGVVVGRVLHAADLELLELRVHADGFAALADVLFGRVEKFGQIFVGESVELRLAEQFVGKAREGIGGKLDFAVGDFTHLFNEIRRNGGHPDDLFDAHALEHCLVDQEVAFVGRRDKARLELIQ